jgi:hypothetical protein
MFKRTSVSKTGIKFKMQLHEAKVDLLTLPRSQSMVTFDLLKIVGMLEMKAPVAKERAETRKELGQLQIQVNFVFIYAGFYIPAW